MSSYSNTSHFLLAAFTSVNWLQQPFATSCTTFPQISFTLATLLFGKICQVFAITSLSSLPFPSLPFHTTTLGPPTIVSHLHAIYAPNKWLKITFSASKADKASNPAILRCLSKHFRSKSGGCGRGGGNLIEIVAQPNTPTGAHREEAHLFEKWKERLAAFCVHLPFYLRAAAKRETCAPRAASFFVASLDLTWLDSTRRQQLFVDRSSSRSLLFSFQKTL